MFSSYLRRLLLSNISGNKDPSSLTTEIITAAAAYGSNTLLTEQVLKRFHYGPHLVGVLHPKLHYFHPYRLRLLINIRLGLIALKTSDTQTSP